MFLKQLFAISLALLLWQQGQAQIPFMLLDSTPVRLRITQTISSADAKVGDVVEFEVLDELVIQNRSVIETGARAVGVVTKAKHKRRLGRGGKLDISIQYVRLTNLEKAALRGSRDTAGGGHTGKMTGAIVATSIVFFPAAPFFLFVKGKDITIPQGTEITAYINGDIRLDEQGFEQLSQ